MLRARESTIKEYKSQGTKFLFLRLFPGWWADVDGDSLVEGGPCWVPNRWHETWNIVLEWCECSNHRTDSKILTQRLFWLRRKNFFNFPLNIGRHDKRLGNMTKRDKYTMRQWTMHSFERLKGLAWLMRVDHHGDQLNTQLTEMICIQVPCSKVMENYWVNPRTWVTLFGKRISAKTEKRTSVEGLLSPRPRS